MSTRRTDDPEESITARPKTPGDEVQPSDTEGRGLSVDVDDLGTQFLRGAVEQQESTRGTGVPEISIQGAPPSDDPLVGPTFEEEHSIWEQTVDVTLEEGPDQATYGEPSLAEEVQLQEPEDPERREVDLSEDTISSGSLFDRESEELGEVDEPEGGDTDDDTRFKHRAPRSRLYTP